MRAIWRPRYTSAAAFLLSNPVAARAALASLRMFRLMFAVGCCGQAGPREVYVRGAGGGDADDFGANRHTHPPLPRVPPFALRPAISCAHAARTHSRLGCLGVVVCHGCRASDNPPVLILFGRTLSLAVAAPHTACLCGQDIKIETAELGGVASSAISYDEKLQTATIRAPPACPAAASRSCAWGACMRGREKGSICAAAAAAAAAARAPPLPPTIHLSSCVRCPRFRRDGARRRHHPLAHLRGSAQRQDVRLLPLHIHRPPPPSQPSPARPPPPAVSQHVLGSGFGNGTSG